MKSQLPKIPGFQIHEEVGRGARNQVFRAICRGRELALKLPREREDLENEYVRYRREASLQARTSGAGLPEIYEVGRRDGTPYLAMELLRGPALSQRLGDGPIPPDQVLELGCQLAQALHVIHSRGLVHRDIKPANILMTENGARIVDFGLATRSYLEEPHGGTFLYSAPEQTGMLNRAVDGRADLYSLGVVLFECLTGQPPFQSSDPGELMRMHAVAPIPDPGTGVPANLAMILKRLLSKDPDDRYRSASDLLEALGRPTPDRLKTRLMGREREMALLEQSWATLKTGKGSFFLIVGGSGSGKSRLAEEFACDLPPQTLVLRGKCCADYQVPFGLVSEILEAATRQLSAEQLRTQAGEVGGSLAYLCGSFARKTGLEPRLEEHHLFEGLASFLLGLGELGPCLLLVDDLHWADESSLRVLVRIQASIASRRAMLVATSRTSDVDLEAQTTLNLKPLTPTAIQQLVDEHLPGRCDPRIAEQITIASNGNPFAALQALGVALDAGAFVPHWGAWRVEVALAELQLPEDLLNLVVRRTDHLTSNQSTILEAAALLGRRFEKDRLEQIVDSDQAEIQNVLTEAIRLRLLEPLDGGWYGFAHDRVQEALVAKLKSETNRRLHQRAAQTYLHSGDPRAVFARADHLALAAPSSCYDTYRANQKAGMRALSQRADQEAYRFFTRAESARPVGVENSWQQEDAFGMACYQSGRFEESHHHFEKALSLCESAVERAKILARLAELNITLANTPEGLKNTTKGLRELGVEVERSPARRVASIAWNTLLSRVPPKKIGDEADLVLVNLLKSSAICAFMEAKPLEVLDILSLGIRAARKRGALRDGAVLTNLWAATLGTAGFPGTALRLAARTLEAAEQSGSPPFLAEVKHYQGLMLHIVGRDREAATVGEEVRREHSPWLDASNFLHTCANLAHNYQFRGLVSRSMVVLEHSSRKAQFSNIPPHVLKTPQVASLAMAGEYAQARRILEEYRDEICQGNLFRQATYFQCWLHLALESNELGRLAEEQIERVTELGIHPLAVPIFLRTFYLLKAYVRLNQCLLARAPTAQLRDAVQELGKTRHLPSLGVHYLVLRAALSRLEGKPRKCRYWLAKAQDAAEREDNVWVRVEVLRQRAFLLRDEGLEEAASREALLASDLASRNGWYSRVQLLEREFGLGSRNTGSGSGSNSSGQGSESAFTVKLKRSLDALVQVTIAAGKMLEGRDLSRRVLAELLKLLAAERAFLFLYEGDKLNFASGLSSSGREMKLPEDYAVDAVRRAAESRSAVLLDGEEQSGVEDLRSVLAAPLSVRDKVVGVVYLDSKLARGVFKDDDVQLLVALANQVAVTLETSRAARLEVQVRAERHQRKLAEGLGQMVGSLLNVTQIGEVLSRLLEGLSLVLKFSGAYTTTCLEEQLKTAAVIGTPKTAPTELVSGSCAPWKEILEAIRPVCTRSDTVCSLSAPIKSSRGCLGTVTLERPAGAEFSDSDVDLFNTFVNYAGIAAESARLFAEVERLATTDELTGVNNRRYFFEKASEEFRRADRLGHPISVVMFDIDHFKSFNDSYGHAIGDLVLRTVARRCVDCLRSIDLIGRYGGEEFGVLLTGTGLPAAEPTAERLRAAIGDEPFGSEAGPLTVTISLGVTERRKGESLEAALDRADKALYQAKESGRNRVTTS